MSEAFTPPLEPAKTRRNDLLKLIALLTMLIDHIGAVFFPEQLLWRTIGRIAFPIFCWQLAEGYVHTSSRIRYSARIFFFGCLAQVPYMFLNPENTLEPLHINIMFQLFSGVLLMAAADGLGRSLKRWREQPFAATAAAVLWGAALCFLIAAPDLANAWNPDFRFSYGTYGQLLMLMFYGLRGRPAATAAAWCALSVLHAVESSFLWAVDDTGLEGIRSLLSLWSSGSALIGTLNWSLGSLLPLSDVYFQARSLMALPLIVLLENRGGRIRLSRWFAYWFYPVHLGLIVALHTFLLKG